MFSWKTLVVTAALCASLELAGGCDIPVEDKSNLAQIVLRVLAVYTDPSNFTNREIRYAANFWLIKVYKGYEQMGELFRIPDRMDDSVYNIRDRKINVSDFYKPSENVKKELVCWKPVVSQKYYILFAKIDNNTLRAFDDHEMGAVEDWTEENEVKVWRGLNWNDWSEWSACSATCGGGLQERVRYCSRAYCVGYNKELRRCNMFSCKGTIEPLALNNQKYFYPSSSLWEKVPNRRSAWRIKPSYYLWLPATEVSFPVAEFQNNFALIVSIRVDPTTKPEGTVFSLRSRSQPNSFLSLNLDGPDVIRLVHSTLNGTQSLAIPAEISDGHWHQLALGIQDDVSVRSYLDCRWVSTDILKSNSLSNTEDADLVIGYLFSGDLEHLILVPDSRSVVQQCSSTKISQLDRKIQKTTTTSPAPLTMRYHRRHHSGDSEKLHFTRDYKQVILDDFDSEDEIFLSDDEDLIRDHGSGQRPIFEMEWSKWSECSASCGLGIQTRHLRCTNAGQPCPISDTEHVQTRQCKGPKCRLSKYGDIVDNHINVDKYGVLKMHRIQQEDLTDVKRCKCHNGGICNKTNKCICPPEYHGAECEHVRDGRCECLNGGTCTAKGTCICRPGYTGNTCGSQICQLNCEPGEICPPATTCDCEDGELFRCNNNTTCRSCRNDGICTKNKCKCTPGWTGVDCSVAICNPQCQNGGFCIKPNECLCRPGTTGEICEHDTCKLGCQNNGVCIGKDVCKCPPFVMGNRCETVYCDPPCTNGATCTSNNVCLCNSTMDHPRCFEKKCNYIAIRKPYTVGVRRLAKPKYGTECRQHPKECATRLVPRFQTIYRTLYRTVYVCDDETKN